jgi:hypothetical protein
MKTIIQLSAAFIAAALITRGVAAFGDDSAGQATASYWTSYNKLVPTVGYYTNMQAGVVAIQESRDSQTGVQNKGDTLLRPTGPMVITRMPTEFHEQNPRFQQQHLWDVNTNVLYTSQGP